MDPVTWITRLLLRKPGPKVSKREAIAIAKGILRTHRRSIHSLIVYEFVDWCQIRQLMGVSGAT